MRDYVELKRLPALAEVMATRPEGRVLTGDHTAENFTTINVTANAFQFLEVPPILGRTIAPSDVRSDGQPEPVIVLTVQAWQRLFDGSPSALGKKLVLNDQILIRVLKSQVFQVPETDFVALSVAVAVLAVAALIACIVPRRACGEARSYVGAET